MAPFPDISAHVVGADGRPTINRRDGSVGADVGPVEPADGGRPWVSHHAEGVGFGAGIVVAARNARQRVTLETVYPVFRSVPGGGSLPFGLCRKTKAIGELNAGCHRVGVDQLP